MDKEEEPAQRPRTFHSRLTVGTGKQIIRHIKDSIYNNKEGKFWFSDIEPTENPNEYSCYVIHISLKKHPVGEPGRLEHHEMIGENLLTIKAKNPKKAEGQIRYALKEQSRKNNLAKRNGNG